MSEVSNYPLRLPKSLKEEVGRVAKREGTSINQFIAIAVAEKVSALETEEYFARKAKGADLAAFKKLLQRKGGQVPVEGDELD